MATKAIAPTTQAKNGLLPTPPMPKGLPKANLTDNARKVLEKRYVRRGDDGKAAENVEEMFWRVAYHVAKVEEQWEADVLKSITIYCRARNSSRIPQHLLVQGLRLGSWLRVSFYRSPMIWGVTVRASSKRCAMRR